MFKLTLRSARVSCGYSLKEVANYCGVSESKFYRFEGDYSLIPIKTLRKIYKLYGVPLELILADPKPRHVREKGRNLLAPVLAESNLVNYKL